MSDNEQHDKIHLFIMKTRGVRFVDRFQQNPSIRKMNIAEHHHFVAQYTLLLCEYLELSTDKQFEALRHAITHDLHEGISFDIPNNVKRKSKRPSKEIEALATAELIEAYDYIKPVSEPIERIVKVADLLDVYFYSVEEYVMGNRFYLPIMAEVKNAIVDVATNTALESLVYDLFSETTADPTLFIKPDMKSITHIHKGFTNATK